MGWQFEIHVFHRLSQNVAPFQIDLHWQTNLESELANLFEYSYLHITTQENLDQNFHMVHPTAKSTPFLSKSNSIAPAAWLASQTTRAPYERARSVIDLISVLAPERY